MRYSSHNNQQELITTIPSKIAFSNFINAIKSLETKEKYSYNFLKYTEYLTIERDKIAELLKQDLKIIESNIIEYIMKLRAEGYSYSSINVRVASIFLFYEMNDVILNKKKISRYIGEHEKTVKDRSYTREEIKKIVDGCDLKYKIVVTLMCSSGCRIGAIVNLRLSALKYIEEYQLYQITFYENSKKDAYYSFCSPECANYIQEYLSFRERCGEKLKPNLPLIRDDFIIGDLLRIANPRPLGLGAYVMHLREILVKVVLRTITPIITSESTANTTAWKDRERRLHKIMASENLYIQQWLTQK